MENEAAPPAIEIKPLFFFFVLGCMAMAKKQGFSSSAAAAPSSEWPDKAVSILLKTYAQKFSVDRGYLRTQDWQEVAHAVNTACDNLKTLKQCRDKVDSLKRRYKMEKRKAVNGGEVSWPFFHRLDEIMNSVLKQGKGQHHKHPNASSAHASVDADDGDDVEYVDEVEEFQEEDEKDDEGGDGDGEEEDEEEGADDDEGEEKLGESNSHDSLSASSDRAPYYLENGKSLGHAEAEYDMSDEDGPYPYHQLHHLYGDDTIHHLRQHRQGHHHPHSRHRPAHVYHDHHFLEQQVLHPSKPHSFSGGTQESTENSSHGKSNRARSRIHKRKLECDNGIDALADAVRGLSKPGSATSFSDVFARIELAKMEILKKVKLEIAKLDRRHKKSASPRKPQKSLSTGS